MFKENTVFSSINVKYYVTLWIFLTSGDIYMWITLFQHAVSSGFGHWNLVVATCLLPTKDCKLQQTFGSFPGNIASFTRRNVCCWMANVPGLEFSSKAGKFIPHDVSWGRGFFPVAYEMFYLDKCLKQDAVLSEMKFTYAIRLVINVSSCFTPLSRSEAAAGLRAFKVLWDHYLSQVLRDLFDLMW